MAGTALLGRLSWQLAEVVGRAEETPRAVTLELDCPAWRGHLPGQHVDVRLTAEDGYQAQRSYSIATPPNERRIALTVERIPDGEVSSYLADELRVGDQLELRGPIGGYFVWRPDDGGPLLLLAAGSGVVPLMAMLRARIAEGSEAPVRLLLSARSLDEVLYRAELERLAGRENGVEIILTLTRTQPPGWTGHARRVDRELLAAVAWPPAEEPRVFVCGPTGFVEAVASSLVELGHPAGRIRTERFGPSGG
jgi:ferredoxin-NADP reductase